MKRILRFTAAWCQPCQTLSKNLETLNHDLHIEVIDIEDKPEIASEYGIRSVPTLIKMDGNTEINRFVGVKSLKQLEDWIND